MSVHANLSYSAAWVDEQQNVCVSFTKICGSNIEKRIYKLLLRVSIQCDKKATIIQWGIWRLLNFKFPQRMKSRRFRSSDLVDHDTGPPLPTRLCLKVWILKTSCNVCRWLLLRNNRQWQKLYFFFRHFYTNSILGARFALPGWFEWQQ